MTIFLDQNCYVPIAEVSVGQGYQIPSIHFNFEFQLFCVAESMCKNA